MSLLDTCTDQDLRDAIEETVDVSPYGLITRYRWIGGKLTKIHTWDAEPYLAEVKRLREIHEGTPWGEGKPIGLIPFPVQEMLGWDTKKCTAWLKENPAFCYYEKGIK